MATLLSAGLNATLKLWLTNASAFHSRTFFFLLSKEKAFSSEVAHYITSKQNNAHLCAKTKRKAGTLRCNRMTNGQKDSRK